LAVQRWEAVVRARRCHGRWPHRSPFVSSWMAQGNSSVQNTSQRPPGLNWLSPPTLLNPSMGPSPPSPAPPASWPRWRPTGSGLAGGALRRCSTKLFDLPTGVISLRSMWWPDNRNSWARRIGVSGVPSQAGLAGGASFLIWSAESCSNTSRAALAHSPRPWQHELAPGGPYDISAPLRWPSSRRAAAAVCGHLSTDDINQ